jgi:hypothetical protein
MALAHAWRDYKECHDPPGMEVWQTIARQGSIAQTVWVYSVAGAADGIDWYTESKEARAAAWAWYERRLALACKLNMLAPQGVTLRRGLHSPDVVPCVWPVILTWTDEQTAEVEHWLVDSTAEMPEVLRG